MMVQLQTTSLKRLMVVQAQPTMLPMTACLASVSSSPCHNLEGETYPCQDSPIRYSSSCQPISDSRGHILSTWNHQNPNHNKLQHIQIDSFSINQCKWNLSLHASKIIRTQCADRLNLETTQKYITCNKVSSIIKCNRSNNNNLLAHPSTASDPRRTIDNHQQLVAILTWWQGPSVEVIWKAKRLPDSIICQVAIIWWINSSNNKFHTQVPKVVEVQLTELTWHR